MRKFGKFNALSCQISQRTKNLAEVVVSNSCTTRGMTSITLQCVTWAVCGSKRGTLFHPLWF